MIRQASHAASVGGLVVLFGLAMFVGFSWHLDRPATVDYATWCVPGVEHEGGE